MGIIYVMTNPAMPNLTKIGKTTRDVAKRAKELSNHAGVPVPFGIEYACEVKDSDSVEGHLHEAFGDHRVNPRKEFFRISPARVIAALKMVAIKDVTPTGDIAEDTAEQESLVRENQRLSRFNFASVKLKPGDELSFAWDESIKATVEDVRSNVKFRRQVMSLSQAALMVINGKKFNRDWSSCQGPAYWVFRDETLADRRNRLEQESD